VYVCMYMYVSMYYMYVYMFICMYVYFYAYFCIYHIYASQSPLCLSSYLTVVALKVGLKSVFAPYGEVGLLLSIAFKSFSLLIVDVLARRNVRMRGQAFVVFRDFASAERALKLNGFPLFTRPMVVSFIYAIVSIYCVFYICYCVFYILRLS
jgi:hypothetical protein